MADHQNRVHQCAGSPTPYQIGEARVLAGLTQTEAGALLHVDGRQWRKWENGERRMHPAFWELFTIKSGAT